MIRHAVIAMALATCACSGQTDDPLANKAGERPPSAEAEAALPDYLADYPGATRVEVADLGAPGTDSRSDNAIAMETDATPAAVADHFRARFAAGVPVRADTAGPDGGLISVARDGERGAMLTISRIGSKTRIAIIRARAQ